MNDYKGQAVGWSYTPFCISPASPWERCFQYQNQMNCPLVLYQFFKTYLIFQFAEHTGNELSYIFFGVSNCPFWGALFTFFIRLNVTLKIIFFLYWVSFSLENLGIFRLPVLIWNDRSLIRSKCFWSPLTAFLCWICCVLEALEHSSSYHYFASPLPGFNHSSASDELYTSDALLSSSNENILRCNKYKDIADLFEDVYFILILFGQVIIFL